MSELSLLFGIFFIAIPVLAITAVFIFAYLNQKRLAQKIDIPCEWKAITAQITAACVEEADRSRDGDDTLYYPSIQFEYTASGRAYKVTQAVGRPDNVISKAWQALSRYPVGKEITVYCNPIHPGEARLWVK